MAQGPRCVSLPGQMTKPSVLSTCHDQFAKKGPALLNLVVVLIFVISIYFSFVLVGFRVESHTATEVRFSDQSGQEDSPFSLFFFTLFHVLSFFSYFFFLLGFCLYLCFVCLFVCLLVYLFIYFARSQFSSLLEVFFLFSVFVQKTLHLFSVCVAFILTGSFCVRQNILNKTEDFFFQFLLQTAGKLNCRHLTTCKRGRFVLQPK